MWFAGSGFVPEIFDETFALLFANINHLDEQTLTVGILSARKIRAVEFRFEWMHNHAWLLVVDPEIIFAVITQRPNGLHGPAFSFIHGKRSALRQLDIMGAERRRGFHGVLSFGSFACVKIVAILDIHPPDDQNENRDNGGAQRKHFAGEF